jgi:2-polyprenyl-3-methyl-5-hydroxy-6-metoxy-1,4-benzoquinol methylase
MDISVRALQQLDRPSRRLVEGDLAQSLGQIGAASDAVLALDVIEHLDDDRVAVTRLGRLARPGGALIVSIPALPSLFTEFDAIQGHRRRYLPETLGAAFADPGLLLERTFWGGRWLVPALLRR